MGCGAGAKAKEEGGWEVEEGGNGSIEVRKKRFNAKATCIGEKKYFATLGGMGM